MKFFRLAAGGLALACLISAPAWAGSVSFSDGDFNPADWTTEINGAGSSVATTEAGGNPGAYRRVSLTVGSSQGVINVQLFNDAVFTPLTGGSVQSVSLSYDARRVFTSNPGATQVALGIAVKQGGTTHTVSGGVTTGTAWNPFSVADIVPLFPAVNWVDGGQITFGFYDSVFGSNFTIDGGYDNFNVTVNFDDTAPVPEPSTLLLLGTGLLGLVGYARRRRA